MAVRRSDRLRIVVHQHTGAYREDIALSGRQGVVNRGVVYPGGSSGERQSCCFPGVCVLPGGRWVASFRAAPTKEGMHDQHPAVLTNGDLLDIFWTYDNQKHRYLTM